MAKVTGIGGIFFKSRDPKALGAWYQKHLDIPIEADFGGWPVRFREHDNPDHVGHLIWSPFKEDTTYFAPSQKPYMINYRVDDLDAVLAKLKAAGVWVDEKIEDFEYGRFGWAMDPEGNRFELWEPKGEDTFDKK